MSELAEPSRFPTGIRDAAPNRPDGEPWTFVQLADPQLGMHNSANGENPGWDEEEAMLRLAVDKINALRPAFAIVCGDLVHEFPEGVGERNADPDRAARSTATFQRAMSRARPGAETFGVRARVPADLRGPAAGRHVDIPRTSDRRRSLAVTWRRRRGCHVDIPRIETGRSGLRRLRVAGSPKDGRARRRRVDRPRTSRSDAAAAT